MNINDVFYTRDEILEFIDPYIGTGSFRGANGCETADPVIQNRGGDADYAFANPPWEWEAAK